MAFPWKAIGSAELASGHIVEDLKLGLDLAAAGWPPAFCSSALVTSEFAVSSEGADSQRRRWEQGHLRVIRTYVPPLLAAAVARRDLGLLALVLDVAVPPLVVFSVFLVAVLAITAAGAAAGLSPAALIIAGIALIAFTLAAGLAWLSCGRDILPARNFASIVPYVLRKFRLHNRFSAAGSVTQWVRTDRKPSGSGPDAPDGQ
jgi:cellulose synthase/poly-beta-1,6-N-acetylglucosamine synthase-like glycosyltransferase